jgi:hypothetical protein
VPCRLSWRAHMNVVYIPSRMIPASRLTDLAARIQLIEAREMLCVTFRRLCCVQIYVAATVSSQGPSDDR